jgi:hypothetical protein
MRPVIAFVSRLIVVARLSSLPGFCSHASYSDDLGYVS